MVGDGHFSKVTNLYVADTVASRLGIKTNDYTIKKGSFTLSSVHLPYYSGPTVVLLEPVFNEASKNDQDAKETQILVIGDSFASTNSFNSYISSLAQCKATTVRHDARSNITLQETLEGKYDVELQQASLVVYIFSAAYIKGNYPTQELIDIMKNVKNKDILFYNVPITGTQKSITINRPDAFSKAKTIKAIVQINPIVAKYSVKINNETVFNYNCDFKYNGGDNSILLQLPSDAFEDGHVQLSVDGNASFKKIVLVNLPE